MNVHTQPPAGYDAEAYQESALIEDPGRHYNGRIPRTDSVDPARDSFVDAVVARLLLKKMTKEQHP
jgi:hypothetical protein